MTRTVKKINGKFEFSTTRGPRLEVYIFEEMRNRVEEYDREIEHLTERKADWEAKISEAEALNGGL